MSQQLATALRAAVDRAMAHRKMLRKAAVLVRLYPEGLVIACQITASVQAELEAGGREVITWEELPALTPERAMQAVDQACAKAHKYLGAAGAA